MRNKCKQKASWRKSQDFFSVSFENIFVLNNASPRALYNFNIVIKKLFLLFHDNLTPYMVNLYVHIFIVSLITIKRQKTIVYYSF